MDHGFQGRAGEEMPDLPDDFRATVTKRYVELYEKVTGRPFEPDPHPNPEERIHSALADYVLEQTS